MKIRILALSLFAYSTFAQRHIPLEGAQNLRDIGGYQAADGKRTKTGLVYRSDALHRLTEADYLKLSELGITTICDFRSTVEREREVTQWRAQPKPEIVSLAMGGGAQSGQDLMRAFMMPILEAMKSGTEHAQSVASQLMADGMNRIVNEEAGQIGRMLRTLANTDRPLLYHCTAGKDRTGLATAILMKLLGVPEEDIYRDYLWVNQLVPPSQYSAAMAKRIEAFTGSPVDAKAFEPLMGTRREWLAAGFAAMGDFDQFRREKLGLSDEDLYRLRSRLLE